MIIPSNFIEDDEIQLMRKVVLIYPIAYSIIYTLSIPFTEYIVWKTKTQKII